MTRINAGIAPHLLTNKHLLAEHREIKRIPNVLAKKVNAVTDIPSEFCLGKGHVKFFYNKMQYLYERYNEIYAECINRGFKVEYYGPAWTSHIDSILWNNWTPNSLVSALVAIRINDRLGLPLGSNLINWHSYVDNKTK